MTQHQPVTSSGYLTSTTQVVTGSGATGASATTGPGGFLHGVTLLSDGSNACTAVIYNSSTNTSGQEVATLSVPASTATPYTITFNNPVSCPKGIRAVLAGTGVTAIVYYSQGC